MSDAGTGQRRTGVAMPATKASGRPVLALGLAALLAVSVVAAAWEYRGAVPIWPLAIGAILAFFGLLALAGMLAGIIRFGGASRERVFLDGLADAIGEACVVSDERGAPVYANAAYLKLAASSGLARL